MKRRAALRLKPWEARRPVESVTLTFERAPSVNAATRNVPGVGRVKTRAYKDWLDVAMFQVSTQQPGCVRGVYHIAFHIQRSSKLADVSNVLKAAEDMLVKMGIIQDDRLCQSGEYCWSGSGTSMTVRVTTTKAG